MQLVNDCMKIYSTLLVIRELEITRVHFTHCPQGLEFKRLSKLEGNVEYLESAYIAVEMLQPLWKTAGKFLGEIRRFQNSTIHLYLCGSFLKACKANKKA